jgi:glutamine kinase
VKAADAHATLQARHPRGRSALATVGRVSRTARPALLRGRAAPPDSAFTFGTKAQTLERLGPILEKSAIPRFRAFTADQWRSSRNIVLDAVAGAFETSSVIVRSSARDEDGQTSGMAGKYLSVPHVPASDRRELASAIDRVVASYARPDGDGGDQVLVQEMVVDISMSGVLFTQDLNTGAPYFVVNYDDESGRTDTVSSGCAHTSNRTLLVHRRSRACLHSARFTALLEAVDELESLTGSDCLDVEFAVGRDGRVHILQVRRITTQPHWNRWITDRVDESLATIRRFVRDHSRPLPGVLGSRSIFGKMPDWNPVEMIGATPRPLASSLYRRLITDRAWRVARAQMGYAEPRGWPLMVLLGGQPFIDARLSFHSFLPATLDAAIGERIVTACLDRLASQPQLHDKIEFEVAITVEPFDFDARVAALFGDSLSADDVVAFRAALRGLTNGLLEGRVTPIAGELAKVARLDERRRSLMAELGEPHLGAVASLLEDCIEYGTIPFSILARHAFVAASLLDSLMVRGVLDEADLARLKRSIPTVAGEFVRDVALFARGNIPTDAFHARYGHLRPGTYEIQSPRYDRHPMLMESFRRSAAEPPALPSFEPTSEMRRGLAALLAEHECGLSSDQFLDYVKGAIQGREYAKFVFTKAVSDALEILAGWGEAQGLSRQDLSHIDIHEILDCLCVGEGRTVAEHLRGLADIGRRDHAVGVALRLPYLITSEADVVIAPLLVGRPNFVTSKSVRGERVTINGHLRLDEDLSGKIIVIEGADPGYDWIFSRGIAGLVTKYGGANSHMTIRCAEFGLPAAIGCGEQIFDRVCEHPWVEIDCAAHRIVPFEM